VGGTVTRFSIINNPITTRSGDTSCTARIGCRVRVVVAVIASLPSVNNPITTRSNDTCCTARIDYRVRVVIAVIAFFHIRLHIPVPARSALTATQAGIRIHLITIITLLYSRAHICIATGCLFTGVQTSIRIVAVAVIASLAGVNNPIAARSSDTSCATRIGSRVRVIVAVITSLAGVNNPITTGARST
jgi:hypothetical protein